MQLPDILKNASKEQIDKILSDPTMKAFIDQVSSTPEAKEIMSKPEFKKQADKLYKRANPTRFLKKGYSVKCKGTTTTTNEQQQVNDYYINLASTTAIPEPTTTRQEENGEIPIVLGGIRKMPRYHVIDCVFHEKTMSRCQESDNNIKDNNNNNKNNSYFKQILDLCVECIKSDLFVRIDLLNWGYEVFEQEYKGKFGWDDKGNPISGTFEDDEDDDDDDELNTVEHMTPSSLLEAVAAPSAEGSSSHKVETNDEPFLQPIQTRKLDKPSDGDDDVLLLDEKESIGNNEIRSDDEGDLAEILNEQSKDFEKLLVEVEKSAINEVDDDDDGDDDGDMADRIQPPYEYDHETRVLCVSLDGLKSSKDFKLGIIVKQGERYLTLQSVRILTSDTCEPFEYNLCMKLENDMHLNNQKFNKSKARLKVLF